VYDAYAKTASRLKKKGAYASNSKSRVHTHHKNIAWYVCGNMDGFRVQYPEELNPISESLCMLNKHTKLIYKRRKPNR
jgi:hypothetical protein